MKEHLDKQYAISSLGIAIGDRLSGNRYNTKIYEARGNEEITDLDVSGSYKDNQILRAKLKARVASGEASQKEVLAYRHLLQKRTNRGLYIGGAIAGGGVLRAGTTLKEKITNFRELKNSDINENTIKGALTGSLLARVTMGGRVKRHAMNEYELEEGIPSRRTRVAYNKAVRSANLDAEKKGRSNLGKIGSHVNRSLDKFRSKKRMNNKKDLAYKYLLKTDQNTNQQTNHHEQI